MNQHVDAIFIGAINLDYIFQGSKKQEQSFMARLEEGAELLNWNIDNGDFDTWIQNMYENYEIKTKQLGGSAFLALKAFKSTDPDLKTAYIGVCGKPTKEDIVKGFNLSNSYFEDIDCKEWFFDLNVLNNAINPDINCTIGRASVLLKKDSTRENIIINAGVNDHILYFINKKEEQGEKLSEFLAKSRWIHITSFADFNIFLKIIEYIRVAKKINPFLRVSADLGDDYTSNKRTRLIQKRVFEVFDFIFLSNKEKENLFVNPYNSKQSKAEKLKLIFQSNNLSNQQILVVKHENCYELYNKIDDKIYVKNFWQRKLHKKYIINDTGAGDFFAGGFIGGMLSDKLLSHQPSPIEIGSIVAKERLKAISIDIACKQANINVNKYLKKMFCDDELNIKQWINKNWEDVKTSRFISLIISFIIGVASGIVSGLLLG